VVATTTSSRRAKSLSARHIWEYLRGNSLSHQVWNGYPAIVDACRRAWNILMAMPHVLRSITHRQYAQVRI
jgi:hypothetical protein